MALLRSAVFILAVNGEKMDVAVGDVQRGSTNDAIDNVRKYEKKIREDLIVGDTNSSIFCCE